MAGDREGAHGGSVREVEQQVGARVKDAKVVEAAESQEKVERDGDGVRIVECWEDVGGAAHLTHLEAKEAIGSSQKQSDAISSNQQQSEAIKLRRISRTSSGIMAWLPKVKTRLAAAESVDDTVCPP